MGASNTAAEDIDGLDEFVQGGPMPMVMGITPENAPRPAFRLERLPPRVRTRTLMDPQYEENEDGKRKLVGFRPRVIEEKIDGGYLVHCMKGHKVAIDSLEKLQSMGLGGYVPMLKLDTDKFGGETVGAVHASQVTVKRNS